MSATIRAWTMAAPVWSYFGRLDARATAPGEIEPASYTKVIEPLDRGKFDAIQVEKSQAVKAGDLLLELDPTEAPADAMIAQNKHMGERAPVAHNRGPEPMEPEGFGGSTPSPQAVA
jgi:hemolysin D